MVASMAFSAIIGAVAGGLSAVFVFSLVRSSSLLGSVPATGAPLASALLPASEEASVESLVRATVPAVASIVIKQPSSPGASDLVDVGGGTGIFVSSDGLLATNRHVVDEPGASFSVVTNDGTELPATVVSRDPLLDIAVLRVQGSGFPTAVLGNSDQVQIGETVVAIGNTLSAFRNTVTKGVVSGVNRTVVAGDSQVPGDTIENAIQTDAAINPGNSGGPLVDLRGDVIGMNTAISYDGQSVGFALPINEVEKDVSDVERYGRIVRPWLGVRYSMIDKDLAAHDKLPVAQGALIGGDGQKDGVVAGGPAADAGFKDGDIILSVDGQALGGALSLGRAISDRRPGDAVTFKILRGDQTVTLEAVLREIPPSGVPNS